MHVGILVPSEARSLHPTMEGGLEGATLTVQKPGRVNILGVGVSAINMELAIRETEQLLDRGGQGYVCVTGVHGIMEAQGDEKFRNILNQSFLTTPDGMPTVWLGRLHGFREMQRVYGPDYMVALC